VADSVHRALRDRVADTSGVILVIGEADSGKTTVSRTLIADAVAAGRSVAYVDADLAASTVGPPACVGLAYFSDGKVLEPGVTPAEIRFVGSTDPNGVVLPHVVAVSKLVNKARDEADLVIVDTSSVVSGVVGQTLKYHLAEMTDPSLVVALQYGNELDPVVAMLRRFFSVRVAESVPPDDLMTLSPTDMVEARAEAFRGNLGEDPQRWRVQTTVFAPTLPAGFDVSRLDSMLVGVQDEHGACLGLGVLEQSDGVVKVATRYGEEMRGLRLGSIRLDLGTYATTRVRLRELIFGV
jgi:polynucleotide 5'-kinase involved in rRNA processing